MERFTGILQAFREAVITMKKIQLSKGYETIVDDEDFEKFGGLRYMAHEHKDINGVVRRVYAIRFYRKNGVKKAIYLHREITKTPRGMVTDHVNGKSLDNRRRNLRSCTHSQNHQNAVKKGFKKGTGGYSSRYKGVSRFRDKWQAHLSSKKEEQAAQAYDEAAEKHYGEFARLNSTQ